MRPRKNRPGDGLDFNSESKYKTYSGTYTNYAIYVDEHIPDIAIPYKNPEIETKVYNYLYRICYVLACKERFFPNFNDYEQFAHFAASYFYIFFRKKYNEQGELKRGKEVEPIKSSLNFIKNVLPYEKVEYIRTYFLDTYKTEWENEDSPKKIKEDKRQNAIDSFIKTSVTEDYNYLIKDAVIETFNNIPIYLKEIINNSPYKKDTLTSNRIYKSCLLSFINSIVIKTKYKNENKNFDYLLKKYAKESTSDSSIILWHLPEDMRGQIYLILTRLKEKLANEVRTDVTTYSLDNVVMDDILKTAFNTYDLDQAGD